MDFSFLAHEAKNIHHFFSSIYYTLIVVLLLVAVLSEYFKIPLGGTPNFGQLISRSFISALMLVSLPEVLNVLAALTDALSQQIGQYNDANLVLAKMGSYVEKLGWNLIDIKKMVLVVISFLSFYLLYWSVYLIEALFFFSWVILYVFSPLLIACFVIPRLSHITIQMYAGFLKVCTWKLVWGVLATLLWTAALNQIENLGDKADLLTLVFFNLILAFSLINTPKIANAIFGKGIDSMADNSGTLAAGAFTLASGRAVGYVTKKLGVAKPLAYADRAVTKLTQPIREPIRTIQNIRNSKSQNSNNESLPHKKTTHSSPQPRRKQ